MLSLAGKQLGQIRLALPDLQRGAAGKFSFARNAHRLVTRSIVSLGFKTLAGKFYSTEPALSLDPRSDKIQIKFGEIVFLIRPAIS